MEMVKWIVFLLPFIPEIIIDVLSQGLDGDLPDDMNELGVSFPPLEEIPPVYFATENNTVVTSQTGSTALVPCVISNIGDGMVSWIRRKDYHLLTVGLTTYSSDDRFQAVHLQHSEDWTLQIKYVQTRDAGLYECQVSSHPPTSIFIQLNVVEAKAEISGPSEKYLKPGSGLRLQCTVLQSTEAPLYVFWYHNNRMINYDFDQGINVTTELPAKVSTLTISNAGTRHSGNYSCVPSNAQPASAYVHILNGGEDPEIFRNRKGYFSINAQFVCDAKLKILNVVARWPGSTHDSTIFNNSYLKRDFENGKYPESLLLGENPAAMQHGGRGFSWLQCSPSSWLFLITLAVTLS